MSELPNPDKTSTKSVSGGDLVGQPHLLLIHPPAQSGIFIRTPFFDIPDRIVLIHDIYPGVFRDFFCNKAEYRFAFIR